ncbi:MAG: metallophosphoesterase [Syntrophobacterales bacterium]|nr:metallophosphoesterase [Syntrophobacterales bacterium]
MTIMEGRDFKGILFIGDPHVASFPPGHRRDEYVETVLGKLSYAMDLAKKEDLLPIILGDLFHVPRNNPNALLVELIRLFKPVFPWVLLGNHDKHEARFTPDVSIAILEAADAIRLIKDYGIVDILSVCGRRVLIGASPDWTPLPDKVNLGDFDTVLWLTHHNLLFDEIGDDIEGEFRGKSFELKEIPGVDLVVNGHLHRPRPPIQRGSTLWFNPGSIVRIIRSHATKEIKPSVTIFRYNENKISLEPVMLPHKSFEEVFYPFSDTKDFDVIEGESRFIRGLENLALRRTAEGIGLREFLRLNLDFDDPIDKEIWKLYQEALEDEQK